MKILRTETLPLELPLREPYRTASGRLEHRSIVLLRIHGGGDHVGLGEAVPLTLRGGAGPATVAEELRGLCGPALVGADLAALAEPNPDSIQGTIGDLVGRCRRAGAGAPALAAVDIALGDLAGKLCGLPTWRLLGASEPVAVRCNASIDATDPGRAAERARDAAARGFETFKVKVGVEGDAERVAAVRVAVGAGARIRVDANRAWGVEEAVAQLDALSGSELELAEQPCPSLAELAAVRARTPVPVIADESVAGPDGATEAVAAGACDAATLKLSKVGGPLEAIRIASIIPSYLSSALDGPIGIAAALHTAQALPRGGYAERFAHGLATLDMFAATYATTDGLYGPSLSPPASPGLGVEIDEGALSELRSDS